MKTNEKVTVVQNGFSERVRTPNKLQAKGELIARFKQFLGQKLLEACDKILAHIIHIGQSLTAEL